jgi:hypothetical protein
MIKKKAGVLHFQRQDLQQFEVREEVPEQTGGEAKLE